MRFLSVFLVAAVAAATATVYLPSSRSAQESSLINAITSTQNILVVSSASVPSSAAPSPISPSESLLKSGSRPTFVLAVPSSFSATSRPTMTSDTFPLSQLASTAKTALVSDGFDQDAVSAFSQKGHKVIRARSSSSKYELFSALSSTLNLDISTTSNGFSVEGTEFKNAEVDAVFGAVVALLGLSPSDRSLSDVSFVVADLSSGLSSIVSSYGAQSAQAAAVKTVVDAAVSRIEGIFGKCVLVASDSLVLDDMEDLYADGDVSSFVKNTVPVSKKNTTITQIFIWFHVALWITFAVVVLYTIKLGLDIEKDTLLYRTTALRNQY